MAPDLAECDPGLGSTVYTSLRKSNRPGGFTGHGFTEIGSLRFGMNILYGGENVTESVNLQNEVPLKTSIPTGEASLELILCTEKLHRRPSRPPDYEKENRALAKLMSALADSPSTILQTLAAAC